MSKETMSEEMELAHSREQLRMTGEAIETSILYSDQQPFIGETERLQLRDRLDRNGVNFKPFQTGVATHERHRYSQEDAFAKETLPAQTAFCLSALSRDKLELVIARTLTHALEQTGGDVYKSSDKEAGISEPSSEDVNQFALDYFQRLIDKDIRFSPKSQSEGIGWKENTIYRLEAIISSTYVLLKTLSFEENQGEAAAEFQTGKPARKFLRERVLRGQAKALEKNNPARIKLEGRTNQEKIIRHLPIKSLAIVTENLLGWS